MKHQNQAPHITSNNQLKTSKAKRIGVILIILSVGLWVAILLVPYLPFSTAVKLLISSSLIVLAEILFWVGGIILGKEVMKKYKNQP